MLSLDRRTLLQGAAAITVAGAPSLASAATAPSRRGLDLLILGGTNFVGPAIVREATLRGHRVTLFNRGKTNPWLFPGLPRLIGDRFPEIGPGLSALNSGKWDAVIDISAYYPRLVEASAKLLHGRVRRYLVMSSISAYASFRHAPITEQSPARQLSGKYVEHHDLHEGDWDTYGGRKAACERIVANIYGQRFSAIRATQIHGWGSDASASYWPLRLARGETVLGPGDGRDPVQIVDVADVAKLTVLMLEHDLQGLYNAIGPDRPIDLRTYVDLCRIAMDGTGRVRWHGSHLPEFQSIPMYAPRSVVPYFATISGAKAEAAGLSLRPLERTIADSALTMIEAKGWDVDFATLDTGLASAREQQLIAETSGPRG